MATYLGVPYQAGLGPDGTRGDAVLPRPAAGGARVHGRGRALA